MTTATSGLLEAVEHLPPGGVLVVPGVPWDEYELLLESMEAHPGHRTTYEQGRLQVVSPMLRHEFLKDVMGRFVQAAAAWHEVGCAGCGGTTLRSKRENRGAEPDACYYLGDTRWLGAKERIDPETDPMPDIIIEIDNTNSSLEKFPVYAALGAPEIWRYFRGRVEIYVLRSEGYDLRERSVKLPLVTASALEVHLKIALDDGQDAALSLFEQWLAVPQ